MTSFPAAARRVRADLPPHDRLLALRECVLRFGPYGFRATWHHLIVSAGIPRQLEGDLDSLRRAVDELEEARLLWLACGAEYEARRTREKAAGQRTPKRADRWHSSGGGVLAYCPDPYLHPRERLATVVQRLIDTYSSGADTSTTCAACLRARSGDAPCPHCGVDPRGAIALWPNDIRVRLAHNWRQIWQYTAFLERNK